MAKYNPLFSTKKKEDEETTTVDINPLFSSYKEPVSRITPQESFDYQVMEEDEDEEEKKKRLEIEEIQAKVKEVLEQKPKPKPEPEKIIGPEEPEKKRFDPLRGIEKLGKRAIDFATDPSTSFMEKVLGKRVYKDTAETIDDFTKPLQAPAKDVGAFITAKDEERELANRQLGKSVNRFFTKDLPSMATSLAKERAETGKTGTVPGLGLVSEFTGIGRLPLPGISGEKAQQKQLRLAEESQRKLEESAIRRDLYLRPDATPGERGAELIGSGLPSLGLAAGLTAATKSTIPASVVFGGMQKGRTYDEAREAGLDPREASNISTAAGVTEGVLEKFGLDIMFKNFKLGKNPVSNFIANSLISSLSEGMQESSQELGSNIWAKIGYDKQRDLWEGVAESGFVGALFGLAGGGAASELNIEKQVYDKAIEVGIPEKESKVISKNVAKKVIEGKATPTDMKEITEEKPTIPEIPEVKKTVIPTVEDMVKKPVVSEVEIKKPITAVEKVGEKVGKTTEEVGKVVEKPTVPIEATPKGGVDNIAQEAGKIEQKAIKEFGTTNVAGSGGFITRDGRMIDSSGFTQGNTTASGGRIEGRAVDHREISQSAFNEDLKPVESLSKFMNEASNVRISVFPKNINVDTIKPLADAQMSTLENISKGKIIYADISKTDSLVAKSGEFKTFSEYKKWHDNYFNQPKGGVKGVETKPTVPITAEVARVKVTPTIPKVELIAKPTIKEVLPKIAKEEVSKPKEERPIAQMVSTGVEKNTKEIIDAIRGRKKGIEFSGDIGRFRELTKRAIIEEAKILPLRERGKLLATVKNAKTQGDFDKALSRIKKLDRQARLRTQVEKTVMSMAKTLPLNERGKLLTRVKEAKTVNDIEKISDTIDRLREESESRGLKSKIEKELKTIKIKKKKGVPLGKFTPEIQKKLNTIKANIRGDREVARQKIDENVNEFGKTDSSGQLLEVPDNIAEENAILNMVGIQDMSSGELNSVLEDIRLLKDEGRTMSALARFNDSGRIDMVKDKSIDEITGGKGLKKGGVGVGGIELETNIVQDITDWIGNAMVGVSGMTEKLSKFTQTSSMKNWSSDLVHDSRQKYTSTIRELTNKDNEKYTEFMGVESKSELKKIARNQQKEKVIFEGENADGDKVTLKMTEEEALDMWMKLKDPTLNDTFDKTMKWTPEIKNAVTNSISQEMKDYGNWLMKDYYKTTRDLMNPRYREKFGVDMHNNPNYSPIKRGGIDPTEDTNLLVGDVFVHHPSTIPSSAKLRTGSRAPLEFQSARDVARRHILQAMQFVAFDKTISDLRKVFSSPDVKESILQYHGEKAHKRLIQVIDHIALGGMDSRMVVKGVDVLIRNFTKSTLALNYVPMLKQLTSHPAFLAEMPSTDYVTGNLAFFKNPVKWSKMFINESETIKDRLTRGFDKETVLALKKGSTKRRIGVAEVNLKQFIINSAIMPTRGGDMIPILPGATAKYLSVTKELKAEGKLNEKEIHRQALRGAEESILKTQQSPHVEDLSLFQTGNSFYRAMSMFQTTPIQYFRNSIEAFRNFRTGRGSRAGNLKRMAIYWVILPSLFQMVSDGMRWDDERQKRAIVLGPLNYIPAIGNLLGTLYDASQGETWQNMATSVSPLFSTLDELQKGTSKFAKYIREGATEDLASSAEEFASAIAKGVGIPLSGPERTIKGVLDLIKGETSDYRRLLYSEYALGTGGKAEKVLEADPIIALRKKFNRKDIVKELKRIDYDPSTISRKQGGKELNDDELEKFSGFVNSEFIKLVDEAMKKDEYKDASANDQKDILQKIMSASKTKAKDEFFGGDYKINKKDEFNINEMLKSYSFGEGKNIYNVLDPKDNPTESRSFIDELISQGKSKADIKSLLDSYYKEARKELKDPFSSSHLKSKRARYKFLNDLLK